jgi:hypothetical protein
VGHTNVLDIGTKSPRPYPEFNRVAGVPNTRCFRYIIRPDSIADFSDYQAIYRRLQELHLYGIYPLD